MVLSSVCKISLILGCFYQVSLTLPEGRHSHSTLLYKEGVVVIGGVDSSTIPLPSVLYLQYYLRGKALEWKSVTVDFTPPLPARYANKNCC